jgi:hypothetical protein
VTQNEQLGKALRGLVRNSEVERNALISVMVFRKFRMRVKGNGVSLVSETLRFWIHVEISFREALAKSATIRVKAFIKILSQCNDIVKVPGTTL